MYLCHGKIVFDKIIVLFAGQSNLVMRCHMFSWSHTKPRLIPDLVLITKH
uniref:Uncharacterized protein n=1 Tax=Rhizophora mucronata TaxID=61149 RepID=A0A2P2Q6Q7_RHIMU